MIIKGLVKSSTIDYTGKLCAVVFLPDCNFRCPYCQNPDLILTPDKLKTHTEKEFLDFLKERKEFLDAVCISGGEPTLHKDLPAFIKKIKHLGYLVKLDTNGSRPDMIKKLLKEKLLDYIAMDIKAPLEKYKKLTGFGETEKITETTHLIISSSVEHEFRTTLLPDLHTKEDILKMAEQTNGAKRFFLQQFRPETTLDPTYQNKKPYSKKQLNQFAKLLEPRFEEVGVRGV